MASVANREPNADSPIELGRRERNKRAKKARILAVARKLFRTQGYANTTTSHIAEAADIGTGTLFLYARSKEDLLVLVFKDEMIAAARDLFSNLSKKASPVSQMMSVFEGMFDYHSQDIEVSKVLLREVNIPSSSERTADIDELLGVVFEGLADIARNAGKRSRIDPELTARTAFAIYYYSLISWIGGAEDREKSLALLRRQLSALLGQEDEND